MLHVLQGIPEIVEKPLTISTSKTYADICSSFKNELSIKEDLEKVRIPTVKEKPYHNDPYYRIFEQPNFG